MKKDNKSGFTLIELLVVIAIIGILAGMIMGASSAVRRNAKRTKARSEVEQIKIAWEQYLTEYHRFPPMTISEMNDTALGIISGYDVKYNRLKIPFLDFSDDTTKFEDGKIEFRDPWGETYKVSLDDNGDNEATGNDGGVVKAIVAVWSSGPDMIVNTRDDLVSWK